VNHTPGRLPLINKVYHSPALPKQALKIKNRSIEAFQACAQLPIFAIILSCRRAAGVAVFHGESGDNTKIKDLTMVPL